MPEITLEKLEARPFVGIRRSLPTTELPTFFGEALPKVFGWLASKGVTPASQPMAMWCAMDMETGIADCHAGAFVSAPMEGEGDITPGMSSAGEALVVMHKGPYSTVGQSWMAAYGRAAELGRKPGAGWEIYVDDPMETPEAELRTQIHLPLL